RRMCCKCVCVCVCVCICKYVCECVRVHQRHCLKKTAEVQMLSEVFVLPLKSCLIEGSSCMTTLNHTPMVNTHTHTHTHTHKNTDTHTHTHTHKRTPSPTR